MTLIFDRTTDRWRLATSAFAAPGLSQVRHVPLSAHEAHRRVRNAGTLARRAGRPDFMGGPSSWARSGGGGTLDAWSPARGMPATPKTNGEYDPDEEAAHLISADEAKDIAIRAAMQHYGLREPRFLGVRNYCRLARRGGINSVTVYEARVGFHEKNILGRYGAQQHYETNVDVHAQSGAVVGIY